MLDTLKTLCALNGVSGCEDEVREYILARALPFAERLETDALGNLMIFKKGARSGEPLLLAAHMDEVGVIITHITDDGYLKFSFVGGVDRRVALGKRVYIGSERVEGVVGVKAYHLVSGEEEKKIPKADELYIDVGAGSREEAEGLVSVGSYGAFASNVFEYGGCLKAKAIDDRIGCAVLLKLIESELPRDVWFAFTVQEEVGLRGAQVVSARLRPTAVLAVEGTTAADFPGVADDKKITRFGGGAVIPFMDKGAIYSKKLTSALKAAADRHGIPHQTKTYIAGATDASAFQTGSGGALAAGVAVPVRNIHSPASCAKISDIEAVLELTKHFLEEFEL